VPLRNARTARPSRAATAVDRDVARIDGLDPLGRGQRVAGRRDRHEQAVDRLRRRGAGRARWGRGWLERGPQECEVDPLMRTGAALQRELRMAAGGTLKVVPAMVIGSAGASGLNRVGAGQRGPQHIGNESGRDGGQRQQGHERQCERPARPLPARCIVGKVGNRHARRSCRESGAEYATRCYPRAVPAPFEN